MWVRPAVCDRVIDFGRRVRPATLAFPLLILFAVPAAVAQTASGAHSATRSELEQRVLDIATMFQNDPRYNKGKTPKQIKDGVEFVTGNVLFVLGHETAHALISEFGIPVLGREEDAADALGDHCLYQDGEFLRRSRGDQRRKGLVPCRPARPERGHAGHVL